MRIYPKGTRVTSSNYNPLPGWMHGAQMVALNMQVLSFFFFICFYDIFLVDNSWSHKISLCNIRSTMENAINRKVCKDSAWLVWVILLIFPDSLVLQHHTSVHWKLGNLLKSLGQMSILGWNLGFTQQYSFFFLNRM